MSHIYSLSLRLVWHEESALVLWPLLRPLSTAPFRLQNTSAFFEKMLQQHEWIAKCEATLQYAKKWMEVENKLERVPPVVGGVLVGSPGSDPYRNTKKDEFRVLDLFIAGEAPLYSLGYFSVGASKPHNAGKLSFLFQELGGLELALFWWRMSPEIEQMPLSLEEVGLLREVLGA